MIVLALIFLFVQNMIRFSDQISSVQRNNLTSEYVVSLDGEWLLITDSMNVGKNENWWKAPVPGARPVKVPWILQDVYPQFHGVVWYWCDFLVNTLQIRINLDSHPAAEPLLRNLLNFAARDQEKPVEKLPVDFDTKLKVIGYK